MGHPNSLIQNALIIDSQMFRKSTRKKFGKQEKFHQIFLYLSDSSIFAPLS